MKIAIFIAGPYRYAHLVQERLEYLLTGVEYDFFYYIWKYDSGNKVRHNTSVCYEKLMYNKNTKVCVIADPYDEEQYVGTIGKKTNSNSSINSTMGMFLSISQLCNYLIRLPDAKSYTHILRIRSDCLIINDKFSKILKQNRNLSLVSRNFNIPSSWISDHIFFSPIRIFLRIWCFNDMNSIYDNYQKGMRNPEKTLLNLTKRHRVHLRKIFSRYIDYHIIYSPPNDNDPHWIKETIHKNGVEFLFKEIDSIKKEIVFSTQLEKLKQKQQNIRDHLTVIQRSKQHIKKILISFYK